MVLLLFNGNWLIVDLVVVSVMFIRCAGVVVWWLCLLEVVGCCGWWFGWVGCGFVTLDLVVLLLWLGVLRLRVLA